MIRQLDTEIIATDLMISHGSAIKIVKQREVVPKKIVMPDYYKKKHRKYRKNIRNSQLEAQDLPLFAYYGTGRLWHEKRLMKKQRQNKMIKKFALLLIRTV